MTESTEENSGNIQKGSLPPGQDFWASRRSGVWWSGNVLQIFCTFT